MTHIRLSDEIEKGKKLKFLIDKASREEAELYVYAREAFTLNTNERTETSSNRIIAKKDLKKVECNSFLEISRDLYKWKIYKNNIEFYPNEKGEYIEFSHSANRDFFILNKGRGNSDIFYPSERYDIDQIFIKYLKRGSDIYSITRGGEDRLIDTLNATIKTLLNYIENPAQENLRDIIKQDYSLNYTALSKYLEDNSVFLFDADVETGTNYKQSSFQKRFSSYLSPYLKRIKKLEE